MQSSTSQTPAVKAAQSKVVPPKLLAAKAAADAEAKKKQRIYRAGAAAFLLLLLGLWYMRPNAQVAKVKQMQQELFGPSASQLSPDEKKQKMDALRAESEKLSPEARKEVRKEMGQQFQSKANAEAVHYLAMSPAERRKVIDEKIAKEQKRAQAPPGGPGAGPSGNPNGAAVQGGGQGGAPRTPPSPESQDDRRRSALLHASAEARAGMDQIRQDMATRRVQLGLPPTSGKGGR